MNKKNELLKGVKKTPNPDECIWVGKPCCLPFLLGHCGLGLNAIIFITIIAFKPILILIIVFLIIYCYLVLDSLFSYVQREYYITSTHLIVKISRKYYYYPVKELRKAEFKLEKHFFDKVFNCKTIQYAKYITFVPGTTSGNNLWEETGKFRSIKDFDFVCEFIEKRTSE